MNDSSTPHNRRTQRSHVLMAASIEAAGVVAPVKLRNLSSDGALVEGDRLLSVGCEVLFRKGELRLTGQVAWIRDKRAGIAFDTKLDPEAVLRHVPRPRKVAKLDFRRPAIRAHALSDGERQIAQDWIFGNPNPSIED